MSTLHGHKVIVLLKKYISTVILSSPPTSCWLRPLHNHKGTALESDPDKKQLFPSCVSQQVREDFKRTVRHTGKERLVLEGLGPLYHQNKA